MTQPPKRLRPTIGIWHDGASSNHGDRAIQQATIDLVFAHWPTAQIVQYHSDPAEGRRIYQDRRIDFRQIGPLGVLPPREGIRGLDLLIWGGGSLVQQSSLAYFPVQAFAALAATRAGVPVICLGSGVEWMPNAQLRSLARHLFENVFHEVVVRGPSSASVLRRIGVTRPVHVMPDQALTLAPSDREEAATFLAETTGLIPDESPLVSISVKPTFIYRGGLLPVTIDLPSRGRNRRRRQRSLLEEAFRGLVRHVAELGARVLLVPMFRGQGDEEACRRVAEGFSAHQARVLATVPASRVLKSLFGLMDAHVGIRLHSCILATAMSVPSVAISYMAKHVEYFQMLNMTKFVISENELTTETLVEAFKSLWNQRLEVRQQLTGRVEILEAEVRNQVDRALRSVDQKWRSAGQ